MKFVTVFVVANFVGGNLAAGMKYKNLVAIYCQVQ